MKPPELFHENITKRRFSCKNQNLTKKRFFTKKIKNCLPDENNPEIVYSLTIQNEVSGAKIYAPG